MKFSKIKLREKVKNLGFIGSDYLPNKDAIIWFISNVFQFLDDKIKLNIYGKVCIHLKSFKSDNIILHGYTESIDNIYSNIDIVINPVRCGAGLKIKNIEALGHGLPLITTSNGSAGIRNQVDKSFLIADHSLAFLEKLNLLIMDFKRRKDLAYNAHKFISEHFSEEKCFDSLVEVINN